MLSPLTACYYVAGATGLSYFSRALNRWKVPPRRARRALAIAVGASLALVLGGLGPLVVALALGYYGLDQRSMRQTAPAPASRTRLSDAAWASAVLGLLLLPFAWKNYLFMASFYLWFGAPARVHPPHAASLHLHGAPQPHSRQPQDLQRPRHFQAISNQMAQGGHHPVARLSAAISLAPTNPATARSTTNDNHFRRRQSAVLLGTADAVAVLCREITAGALQHARLLTTG